MIALLLVFIMMCVPTSVKAEMEYDPVITEEIVYQDAQYMIRVITIVEQENVSFFATTNTKSASRVWTVENVFGNVVASYTLESFKNSFRNINTYL